MTRQRHSDRELEEVLQDVEAHGWRVTRKNKYFQTWCPCADKHHKTVKLTPSNRNYRRNLRAWFKRQPCWEEGEA